jgi:prefoldin subunit 5
VNLDQRINAMEVSLGLAGTAMTEAKTKLEDQLKVEIINKTEEAKQTIYEVARDAGVEFERIKNISGTAFVEHSNSISKHEVTLIEHQQQLQVHHAALQQNVDRLNKQEEVIKSNIATINSNAAMIQQQKVSMDVVNSTIATLTKLNPEGMADIQVGIASLTSANGALKHNLSLAEKRLEDISVEFGMLRSKIETNEGGGGRGDNDGKNAKKGKGYLPFKELVPKKFSNKLEEWR